MKKFMLCGVSCLALFAANNALAADGYVCEESVMSYTSCKTGYYLTTGESGLNVCQSCPSFNAFLDGEAEVWEEVYTAGWGQGQWQDDLMLAWNEDFLDGGQSAGDLPSACLYSFNSEFIFNGGRYSPDNAQYPSLVCAVVTDSNMELRTGVSIGEYVCFYYVDSAELQCGGGWILSGECFGEDDQNCNVHDAILDDQTSPTTGSNFYVVKNVGDLNCQKVSSGYFSEDGALTETICSDTTITEDRINVGQYCPSGAAAPEQCPQATNTLNGAVVYGVTGISGASSITQCKLPAGDVVYENDYGTYQLVDTCSYVRTGTAGGMLAACLAYKAETDNENIDCENFICDITDESAEEMIYDPDGGGIACYENMDCQNDTLMSLKSNCVSSGGTWDSSTALCTCAAGKSFTCNTGAGFQDGEGNQTFTHWCE